MRHKSLQETKDWWINGLNSNGIPLLKNPKQRPYHRVRHIKYFEKENDDDEDNSDVDCYDEFCECGRNAIGHCWICGAYICVYCRDRHDELCLECYEERSNMPLEVAYMYHVDEYEPELWAEYLQNYN
jgi:hypothetical protein